MAKINISFNNSLYNIDEAALASATNELKQHLSTVMNGTGATIKLGGASYDIDSTKLSNATNDFVTHLGTVAGEGTKVKVNDVEYSVGSDKLASAITELETVLGGLHSDNNGSDDDLESGSLPISWNTLAVVGNPYVDVGDGMMLVKISDKTLTAEELGESELCISADGATMRISLSDLQTVGEVAMATYVGESFGTMVVSTTTTDVIEGYGIAFPEVGLYAMDYSQMGSIDFTLREAIELPTPSAPDAPTAQNISANSITLNAVDGCEYSMDGSNWQSNPGFYGLEPETEYTVYMRYKATLTHNASEVSSALICTDRLTASIESYNRAYIGYTDETTELVIPEFYYTDSNYKCYVTGIGSGAFDNCENLTSVVIAEGVTSIGEGAFYGCTNLASVVIPDSVTSIDCSAFGKCTSLNNVTIPTGITTINTGLFNTCTNLTSVDIPYGVTSIGLVAFYGCANLTNISIPASVTSIGEGAFGDTGLTSVIIPFGVTTIDKRAFENCHALTSITLPTTVTQLSDDVLGACENLTEIHYGGTTAQWQALIKESGGTSYGGWISNNDKYVVYCTDGNITK